VRAKTISIGGTGVAVRVAGAGHPLLVLHGLGLDHRGLADGLEPVCRSSPGWRRIYVDLPGMGDTPPKKDLANANALLDLLEALVDELIGDARFAVFGQSYGAHLGLGLHQRRPNQISGMALTVPVVEPEDDKRVLPVPTKLAIDDRAMEDLPEEFLEGFRSLIVSESPDVAGALARSWIPAVLAADDAFLANLREGAYAIPGLVMSTVEFNGPSLVLCGRQDAVVGHLQATELGSRMERATIAVLDGAGHAAQLEKSALFEALVRDWLGRVLLEEDSL
jgi:pimeloyl-ACP methyl ester carboxylesterase